MTVISYQTNWYGSNFLHKKMTKLLFQTCVFLPPRMANAQKITFDIILQWKFDPYLLVWHQVSMLCCGGLSWVRLEKKLCFIILNERCVVMVLNILLFSQRIQVGLVEFYNRHNLISKRLPGSRVDPGNKCRTLLTFCWHPVHLV